MLLCASYAAYTVYFQSSTIKKIKNKIPWHLTTRYTGPCHVWNQIGDPDAKHERNTKATTIRVNIDGRQPADRPRRFLCVSSRVLYVCPVVRGKDAMSDFVCLFVCAISFSLLKRETCRKSEQKGERAQKARENGGCQRRKTRRRWRRARGRRLRGSGRPEWRREGEGSRRRRARRKPTAGSSVRARMPPVYHRYSVYSFSLRFQYKIANTDAWGAAGVVFPLDLKSRGNFSEPYKKVPAGSLFL